jgi:hypothetical protein
MTGENRGNWPHWYGRCGMSDGARSDLARWAFYNIGAQMTSRTPYPAPIGPATRERTVTAIAERIREDTGIAWEYACRDAERAFDALCATPNRHDS